MPRLLMVVESRVQVLDERLEEVGAFAISREVAIASKSKGADEIIEMVSTEIGEEIVKHTKVMFASENSKK